MRTGNIRVHNNFIRVFLSLLMVCFLFSVSSVNVSASGWVDKTDAVYEKLYGTPDMEGQEVQAAQSDDANWFEQIISGLIVSLSKGLNNLLGNRDIDLSIDGIVFGRMAATLSDSGYVEADFTHFGLEENNPWGIIGATIFYALRSICLVVMPIILLVLLILELFHNTGKGRARLKELAIHTVYVFGLLFILPYALDLFIYFRDVVLYSVYGAMNNLVAGISGGATENKGLVDMMLEVQDGRILNALVLLASVCAGAFFLFDYIRIALLLTIAFGIFPIIAVMSFWNNKKLSEWSNVFFPNLLVPFIDMLLVLIPTFLQALFVRIFGSGFSTVLMGVIILIVIWNVVAVRNRIVKLLGFDGLGGGGNIGQMLETLSHLRSGKKEEKSSERPDEDKNEESNSPVAAASVGGASHYSESNQMVDGVVNNESINSGSADASGSEVDGYLSSMEDRTTDSTASVVEKHNVDSETLYAASAGGVETAKESATEDMLSNMEEAVVVTPEPIPGMEATVAETVQVGTTADAVVNERQSSQPSQSREQRIEDLGERSGRENKSEGTPGDGKKLLTGAGKVAAYGVKTTAKVAGGAVLGTTAAFAAGYGGMGASLGAGIVGAHVGAQGGEQLGEKIVSDGPEAVKNAVMAKYRQDFALFHADSEVSELRAKQAQLDKQAKQGAKDANARNDARYQEVKDEHKKHDEKAHKDLE